MSMRTTIRTERFRLIVPAAAVALFALTAVIAAPLVTAPEPAPASETEAAQSSAQAEQQQPPTSQPVNDETTQSAADTGSALERGDRSELRDLIDALLGTNRAYGDPSQQSLLSESTIVLPGPAKWQPSVQDANAAREVTLAERSLRRAYDGAPPVMPHSRNFVRTKTCLDCHADGIWLGKRFGPPVSHPELVSCTQCHVESENLELPIDVEVVRNAFAGRAAPFGGQQAWPGAPPVVPHATLMRTRCTSCHSAQGRPGLRTDHPQRLNCMQCHGTAASLDQTSPFFTGEATMLETEPAETSGP